MPLIFLRSEQIWVDIFSVTFAFINDEVLGPVAMILSSEPRMMSSEAGRQRFPNGYTATISCMAAKARQLLFPDLGCRHIKDF